MSLAKVYPPIQFEQHTFRSTEEEVEAQKFNELQRHNIKNTMLGCINEKLTLATNDPNFTASHKYLRGQIDILRYLLALDDNMRSNLAV